MKVEIEKLRKVSFINKLVFAYLACERLYPNYIYFSMRFSFGNVDVLRKSITYIKSIISGEKINRDEVLNHIENVDINTPDTDDFNTIYVSSALDACCAILDSLQLLLDQEFEHLTNISMYGIETVNMYVNSDEGIDVPELDQHISKTPLMEREFAIQNEIISFLVSHEKATISDVGFLSNLQGNLGSLKLLHK